MNECPSSCQSMEIRILMRWHDDNDKIPNNQSHFSPCPPQWLRDRAHRQNRNSNSGIVYKSGTLALLTIHDHHTYVQEEGLIGGGWNASRTLTPSFPPPPYPRRGGNDEQGHEPLMGPGWPGSVTCISRFLSWSQNQHLMTR